MSKEYLFNVDKMKPQVFVIDLNSLRAKRPGPPRTNGLPPGPLEKFFVSRNVPLSGLAREMEVSYTAVYFWFRKTGIPKKRLPKLEAIKNAILSWEERHGRQF